MQQFNHPCCTSFGHLGCNNQRDAVVRRLSFCDPLSPASTGPARHGTASRKRATPRAGPRMARCRWGPGGRRDRSEGAPETIDADPVTGECLAPGLPCSEAARVTSERKRGSDAGGKP